MNKRAFIIIVIIFALAGIISVMYLNSNYYYSKKLVAAIREESIAEVQKIIEKKPGCINTYPSVISKWWQSAMDLRFYFPFNEACGTSNIELVTLLLENGADPNCNDGLTPLSITYSGKYDNWYMISQILIQYGASLDYTTEYSGGKSSILVDIVKVRSGAALPGYEPENEEEVIQAFHYALENCDHSKVNWMKVLQESVSNSRIKIVKYLLDKGYCDVNDNSFTMTALMYAVRDSNLEMVALLLEYGADKNAVDDEGLTAYDFAIKYNKSEDVAALCRPDVD